MSEFSRRDALQAASVVGGAALIGLVANSGEAQERANVQLVPRDYAQEQLNSLATITTNSSFCDKWKDTIRPIAVAIQGILKLIYPAGAKTMELIIAFIDIACGGMR